MEGRPGPPGVEGGMSSLSSVSQIWKEKTPPAESKNYLSNYIRTEEITSPLLTFQSPPTQDFTKNNLALFERRTLSCKPLFEKIRII